MTRQFPNRIASAGAHGAARWVVYALLGCMLACIVGLPVPPPSKTDVVSELFPCMDNPCGCKTAAQCWEKCCCYDDAQKIAWAQQHDVVPPSFVIARHELAQQRAVAGANLARPCCAKQQACESRPASSAAVAVGQPEKKLVSVAVPDQPGCCSEETPGDAAGQPVGAQSGSPGGSRIVLWSAVQRCRGIDLVWTLLATGWLPECREPLTLPDPLLVLTYRIEDTVGESISFAPDPPVGWLYPVV